MNYYVTSQFNNNLLNAQVVQHQIGIQLRMTDLEGCERNQS
jgi:hypothetical protein